MVVICLVCLFVCLFVCSNPFQASLGLSDMLLPHGDGETPRDLLFPAGRRIDVDAVRCHYGISTYAEMIDLFRNLVSYISVRMYYRRGQ